LAIAVKASPTRLVLAFLLAPLAAPFILFAMVMLSAGPTYSGWFTAFMVMMVTGTIASYFMAGLFGLPLFLLFRRLGLINFWTLTIGAALIGMLPPLVVRFQSGSAHIFPNLPNTATLAICGYAVGFTFWLLVGPLAPAEDTLK
jgi:hypothetical protein